jgi:hypothetical protein
MSHARIVTHAIQAHLQVRAAKTRFRPARRTGQRVLRAALPTMSRQRHGVIVFFPALLASHLLREPKRSNFFDARLENTSTDRISVWKTRFPLVWCAVQFPTSEPTAIEHPAFIVAEIPEPVRSQIQVLRDSLKTITAKLPVEITLAGSSGVGPILPGVDLSLIKQHLDRVLLNYRVFSTQFSAIRVFPNTSIYYLEPLDRSPFDHLHQLLRTSGIPFCVNRWPYNPHCTVRGGAPLSHEAARELLSGSFPKEEFRIETVSIYHLDPATQNHKLLYQQTLREES